VSAAIPPSAPELTHETTKPADYPVKWVLLYGFNVVFNVITMMRIVKRESSSVFYWMCETAALLIFRVHHIYYHPDEFWLAKSELYRVTNIIIDGEIDNRNLRLKLNS